MEDSGKYRDCKFPEFDPFPSPCLGRTTYVLIRQCSSSPAAIHLAPVFSIALNARRRSGLLPYFLLAGSLFGCSLSDTLASATDGIAFTMFEFLVWYLSAIRSLGSRFFLRFGL